ncbi:MAG: isoprenylcysteine carboxylmethyltransferase family protein [Ruminococcaceae bacterium]|nr:isoprenylcysteine carboxylmethyltransferase family protein [Oscillospiraceae bacterium]
MTLKLFFQALIKFVCGVILVGSLLFVPAGTFYYTSAWILMGVLFVPMFIAGIVMMIKNPALLSSRLKADEKEKQQQNVIKYSAVMFVLGFVAAGLDFRFSITRLDTWITYAGVAVFIIAYLLYAEVLVENTYLSRTIEVQNGQKVIDTGLYGIVRHPMYTATIFLFISMPIILGSALSLLIFCAYPFIIALRIKNEEGVLEIELEGYTEYKKRVRYKMIPFIY